MIRHLSIAAFLLIAGTTLVPCDAHAQWGWQGYNGYNGVGVYSIYDQDRLPYFALHPPVYYSKPVPRTFGYSPFAYPGWVPTPALQTVEPTMIVNPYFDQSPVEGAGEPRTPTAAPPAASPPAAKAPGLKVGPLQGFKPRSNMKGFENAPRGDKSAAAKQPSVSPLRIVNPYVDGRIMAASLRSRGE